MALAIGGEANLGSYEQGGDECDVEASAVRLYKAGGQGEPGGKLARVPGTGSLRAFQGGCAGTGSPKETLCAPEALGVWGISARRAGNLRAPEACTRILVRQRGDKTGRRWEK